MNMGRTASGQHDRVDMGDAGQVAAVVGNTIPEVTIKCACQSTPSRLRRCPIHIRETKSTLISNSHIKKRRFSSISLTNCEQKDDIIEQLHSVLRQINTGVHLYRNPKCLSELSLPNSLLSCQISGSHFSTHPEGCLLLIQGKTIERTTDRVNKTLSVWLCSCTRSTLAVTRPFKFVKDFDDSLLINGEKDNQVPLLWANESLRAVFHHGDVEYAAHIVIIKEIMSVSDIWDGLDCLTFLCKTKPSYFGTPSLERLRIPRQVHGRIFCQELEKPSDYLDSTYHCVMKALGFKKKSELGLGDVSTTNVMSLGSLSELCDIGLENNDGARFASHIKTGTSLFLAYEVESNGYHFIPLARTLSYDQLWAIFKLPVRCNLLHDLESAWWSFFWTVVNGNLVKFAKENRDIMFDYKFARDRLRYTRDATKYTMDYILVDPSETSNPAVVMLHAVRMRLVSLYHQIETHTDVDEWDFANLHHELIKAFDDANLEKCRAQLEDYIWPMNRQAGGDGDSGVPKEEMN